MTPTVTKQSILDAIAVLVEASPYIPADSILRLRAISAAADLRGQLLAAVPNDVAIRDAA